MEQKINQIANNEIFNYLLNIHFFPILIAILIFALLVFLVITYHPEDALIQTYEKINDSFANNKKNKFINYADMSNFLIANGIAYKYPRLANPIAFLSIKICLAAGVSLIIAEIHFALIPIGLIVGWVLPDKLVKSYNKKCNYKMLSDLQLLFNSLAIQIKGGLHVTSAVYECYDIVEFPRLKDALQELEAESILQGDFKNALMLFQSKFDNQYINSLCIALMQALDSGKAVDLIGDIGEQLKEMHVTYLDKKRDEMEKSMTISIVLLVASTIFFILYMFVTNIGVAILGF